MARIANSLATLRSQYNAKYPNRNKASDGWIGDPSHQARVSDHNPDGRGIVAALDITHDPVQGLDCNAEVEKIIKDSRVKYVIWNRRIWEPGIGWKTYSGSNPHTKHMHISVKSSVYDQAQEWNLSQGGNAVNEKFTNEAQLKRYYMLLRGDEATLEERKGWIGKTADDFLNSPNTHTEARNNAAERAKVHQLQTDLRVITEQFNALKESKPTGQGATQKQLEAEAAMDAMAKGDKLAREYAMKYGG